MATYYIRNSIGNVSQDGSRLSPFLSLESCIASIGSNLTGHNLKFYSNDTFDELVNATGFNLTGNNFTIDSYWPANQDSSRATLTRAKRNFTWVSVGSGVYESIEALGNGGAFGTYGGCIAEDGVIMNMVLMTVSQAATISAMTVGTSSFNPNTGKYLVYPRTGDPSSHTYAGCAGVFAPIRITTGAHSFTVKNLITEFASEGMPFGGSGASATAGNILFDNLLVRHMGGGFSSTTIGSGFYAGDGLSTLGAIDTYGKTKITNCVITQIFDGGSGPQTIDGTNISGIEYDNVDISYTGLVGLTFAIVNAGVASVISNNTFKNGRISNIGYGFSGDRGGIGYQLFNANSSTAGTLMQNNIFTNNVISNCKSYGARMIQGSGSNEISRNVISGCLVGATQTTRTGAVYLASTDVIKYNIVKDCTTGISSENSVTGLASVASNISNNTVINCTTGISDGAKASDTVRITNNLIVGCTTGISSASVSTLVKSTNNLSNCTSNYSGTTQGTDTLTTVTLDASYVPSTLLTGTAQQPDVDYNGNYANSIVGATNKANQHIIGYFI